MFDEDFRNGQWFVGNMGELSTNEKNAGSDPINVRGYPVFRRYRENGTIFNEAWFVTEEDARQWVELKNRNNTDDP